MRMNSHLKPENPDSNAIKFVMTKKIDDIKSHFKFKLSVEYTNMFSDLKRRWIKSLIIKL